MAPPIATPGTRRARIARVADRATGCARGRRRSCAAARRPSEAGRRAVLRARLTRAACARLRGAAVLPPAVFIPRSEEHTSELQSLRHLVCRILLEKKTRIH